MAGVALYVEVGHRQSLRTLLRWHAMALISLPLLAVWFAFTRPDLASHQGSEELTRWGHKLLNANSLGFACTIVVLWATSELRSAWLGRSQSKGDGPETWKTRLLPLLPLVLCVAVLLLARSRTAMLTLALGQAILWWPRGPLHMGHARFASLLLALGVILAWNQGTVSDWMLRGESVESLASATGRTDLWTELLAEQVPKAPIAGAGYLMLSEEGGFSHAGRIWTNAHNTYLFALVSTGLVGLALVLLVVFLPWWRSLRGYLHKDPAQEEANALLFALQSVLLATSITGFGVFGFPNPAMLLFYSLYALVICRSQRSHRLAPNTHSQPRPGWCERLEPAS